MPSISLPAIGAFVATYGTAIAAGASVVAGGVTAYEAHVQGEAQANQAKQKARTVGDQAAQQQIQMRQNMLRALASQNAGTLGAVGTGAASGFGANAKRQINQNQNDLMVSSANSSAQISLLDQQASNDVAAGNATAAGDAVNTLGKLVKTGP